MSKELYNKASRTKILSSLPSKELGSDGDIVLSNIQGKGTYLCAKSKGQWYVANKLEELRKLEKTSIRDLSVNKLRLGDATLTKQEYNTNEDFTLDSDGSIELDSDGGITLDAVRAIVLDSEARDITLNSGTDITLDTGVDAGTSIYLSANGNTFGLFEGGIGALKSRMFLYEAGGTSTDDYLMIQVTANGAANITTLDAAGADGDITLAPDGDLVLDPVSTKVIINATDDLYLDGGGDTYITEDSADSLQIIVGGDIMLQFVEGGDNGNEANFRSDTCVGFTRKEATFSATGIIGSGGTDDTDIDFRFCNKYRLEMTGDITTINLIFPAVSGNFLLVCPTDGDHDVTNWKVFIQSESAASTTDVMWAGGSVPAFTSSGIDIVSFYWDANEQQAYGTASLAFATP